MFSLLPKPCVNAIPLCGKTALPCNIPLSISKTDDRNVLRFHIDYFKPENSDPEEIRIIQRAVVKTILTKHDAATNNRRFNAIMATSSINDAIEYYKLFKSVQNSKKSEDSNFNPLNVVCVFSPPAANNRDVM